MFKNLAIKIRNNWRVGPEITKPCGYNVYGKWGEYFEKCLYPYM